MVRTYLSPQGLAALWVMAARLQGEFRWVGWCFSQLGWVGWFKGELVGEWVSVKPNGLLIGINRFRTLFWNDHSHFILKILLEISELNTQITPVSQQPPFQVMLPCEAGSEVQRPFRGRLLRGINWGSWRTNCTRLLADNKTTE